MMETLYRYYSSVTVDSGGSNYKVGDEINVLVEVVEVLVKV